MSLVSVVIPAYNSSRYIAETISSIVQQQSVAVEIIVVDDGSTDGTGAIASSFGDPVRVIEQRNSGVCVARNRGLKEARGEFIAFVDHDDYWYPYKLSSQLQAFRAAPEVDVVFTRFIKWNPSGDEGRFPSPPSFLDNVVGQGSDPAFSGWIYHQMLLDSQVLTSTAVAKTEVIVRSGGFDESLPYGEDWDFWLRLSRQSQFLKLNEATTLYRQHPTQGSRTVRPVDYRTQILEKAFEIWGLCSPDGRCISRRLFRRQLAEYSSSFGLAHLGGGEGAQRAIAARSLVRAFQIDPTYWRSLAYLAFMLVGWKPKWQR